MKYFGFADRDDVRMEFSNYNDLIKRFPTDEKILLAVYNQESWEGDAYVLFERYGKLYEVHGSHCSCYGLEDQWQPEETSWEFMVSKHFYVPSCVRAYPDALRLLDDLIHRHTGVLVLRD